MVYILSETMQIEVWLGFSNEKEKIVVEFGKQIGGGTTWSWKRPAALLLCKFDLVMLQSSLYLFYQIWKWNYSFLLLLFISSRKTFPCDNVVSHSHLSCHNYIMQGTQDEILLTKIINIDTLGLHSRLL